MSRPIRIRIAAAVVALASMSLLAATSASPFDPLASVPAGALAVVTVGDPSSFLANSIGFLRGAGLEEPAVAVEDFIRSMTQSEADGEADEDARALMRSIDPGKRFIVALYPGVSDAEAPAALLFLPLRSTLSIDGGDALTEAVDRLMASGEAAASAAMDYPGYAVIRTDGGDIPPYGSGAAMDLSALATYPASSVAVWADPTAGARYLDMLPENLGSMFGPDEADIGDDYEYWSGEAPAEEDGYAPLDNQPSGADDETGTGESLEEISGGDGATDNPAAEASAADNAVDNEPASGEEPLGDEEFADDFSWDEDADGADMYGADIYGDDASGASAAPLAGELAALGEALQSSLEQIRGLEFALIVQKERAWFRAGARVSPDGDLAAMARRASEGDRSLPYLAYCESDALISAAWSAPTDWMLPLFEALYGLIMPDEGLAAASIEALKASASASGMNGGASISLSPSEELLGTIRDGGNPGSEAVMDLLTRGPGLSVTGAMEVTDRQAFRDAAAKSLDLVKDPAYVELMASSGMAFDIRRSVGVVNGMPYDAYAYSFIAPDEADGEAAAIANLMGGVLSPVYIYKNDKAFFGTGPLKDVVAAMPANGARNPLRSDKAFRALRAGAPADVRALFYLSTKALSRIILRAMPENGRPLAFNAGALSGFLSWFDATPSSLGFGFGIGAEDIKAIINIIN